MSDHAELVVVSRSGVTRMVWQEVFREASSISDDLRRRQSDDGRKVVLIAADSAIAQAVAFFAVCTAGGRPVLAPGPNATPRARWQHRVAAMINACEPTLLLVERAALPRIRDLLPMDSPIAIVALEDLQRASAVPRPILPTCEFVQFTSGTTGYPTGIEISPENLAACVVQACEVYGLTSRDVTCNWVPLHHDMGLVTSLLWPAHLGMTTVLVEPSWFVASPICWLQAIGAWRATFTSTPNFALDLLVRRHGLSWSASLASLRILRLAAEPIRATTIAAALPALRDHGLPPGAVCPSYGMAEATLTVTSGRPGEDLVFRRHDGRSVLEPIDPETAVRENYVTVADLGVPVPGATCTVRPDDPAQRTPDAAPVGLIEIVGPQLANHRLTDGERRTFPHPYETADLGAIVKGRIHLVGRVDDTIIHNGSCWHLGDLDEALQARTFGARGGRVLTLPTGRGEAPALTVLAEAHARTPTILRQVEVQVRGIISELCGLPVHDVVLLAPGTLPVTTSGKLSRKLARQWWEEHSAL